MSVWHEIWSVVRSNKNGFFGFGVCPTWTGWFKNLVAKACTEAGQVAPRRADENPEPC